MDTGMNLQDEVDYGGSLGEISNQQFDKALQKLNLGRLVKVEKIQYGVVGQNVFLTSTKGEYVFRGRPFYDEQFAVEKFAVEYLREKTNVNTAYPYIIDNNTDIFGFRYAIMPRLFGIQIANGDTSILDLPKGERFKIARAMAEVLTEMHKCKYEPENLFPFRCGHENSETYPEWAIGRIKGGIEDLPDITKDDIKYVDDIVEMNKDALLVPFELSFLMGDFKEDNVLLSNEKGEWKVCAVFDFAMVNFGDSERDLSRLYAMYSDEDRNLAKEFINTYVKLNPPREGFVSRFRLYSLMERIEIWRWVKNRGEGTWRDENITLSKWLEPYLNIDLSEVN